MICAYVAYCILREHSFRPSEAWSLIGCIYGDDGILYPVKPTLASLVAAELGMTLKVDIIKRGQAIGLLSSCW